MVFKSGNSSAAQTESRDIPADFIAAQSSWTHRSTGWKPAAHKRKKHETSPAALESSNTSTMPGKCRFDFGSNVSSDANNAHTNDRKEHHEQSFIELQVNGTSFEASISALSMASPVLNEELQADASSKKGEKVKMQLEGSEKAVSIFLAILHYRFAQIPTTLTLSELFEVACLVNKYKCAHIIQPWAVAWVEACKSELSKVDTHKAIWIAYALGDVAWYKEMFKAMVLSTKLHDDSTDAGQRRHDLCNEEGIQLKDMILPELLLDIIAETRDVLVVSILEAVATAFKQISAEPRDSQQKFCRVNKDQEQCEDLLVGSAFKQLARQGLMPVPKASDYHGSIQLLADQVRSLKLSRLIVQGDAPHQSHEGCSLGLSPAIDDILADVPVILTHEHQEHMQVQGAATGLAISDSDVVVGTTSEVAEPKRQTRCDVWVNESRTPSIAGSSS